MSGLSVGDDVRIMNYTGMADPEGWRIRELRGSLATIYRPDSDPRAILAFTNTMRISVERLEAVTDLVATDPEAKKSVSNPPKETHED